MTTERMTDEDVRRHRATVDIELDFSCGCDLDDDTHDDDCPGTALEDSVEQLKADHDRARRVEEEQAAEIAILKQSQAAQKHVIEELREQLRLTNDKMAEQVRQAIWNMADEAIQTVAGSDIWVWLTRIRDANAPKD